MREGVVRIAEDLLRACLLKQRDKLPPGITATIVEIPEEERDPSFPCRLRVDARFGSGGPRRAGSK